MPIQKWSVLDLAPIYEGVDPACALKQAVLLAQTAEQLGYCRYWVAEHHDMPGLASSTPEVLLAHIGAQTHRIRIGSGAVLLPHYKPYKVAEAFHLLATLYPGRIDLGVGRAPGGSAHATLALNDRFLQDVGRMPELVQQLSALLRQEFTVEGESVVARPIPPLPPKLWLLGTNQKSAGYAAENGAGYVYGLFMSEAEGEEVVAAYRRDYKPSVHQPNPEVIVAVGVICAETMEEANACVRLSQKAFRRPPIVGDPSHVREKLEEIAWRYQAEEIMVITDFPDYARRLRSYELIANSVFDRGSSGCGKT
ncbi:MsnO8 family LLM class oxidoreductase [Brevibacillus sp. 1238]|jgi:luciferase family oxidoreductase group 1|uniref:MsnO8 family LLM class oxidoreductase n=1 Tax=Brevibacillus sp. 1238 TaxID=2940565 RepID=UPI00247609FC|nr:MsnO8 family LLM class oxidoreductase [Brevibacillus sp. 1238]MDH6349434.1 luciferase family oxidoreductase group 1 [Brevibacillus sp. 1238]